MNILIVVFAGVAVGFVLLFAMFMAGVRLIVKCVNEEGEANFLLLAVGVTLLIVSSSGGAVVYQLLANTDLDVIEALAVGSVMSMLVVTLILLSLRIATSVKRRKHGQKTP